MCCIVELVILVTLTLFLSCIPGSLFALSCSFFFPSGKMAAHYDIASDPNSSSSLHSDTKLPHLKQVRRCRRCPIDVEMHDFHRYFLTKYFSKTSCFDRTPTPPFPKCPPCPQRAGEEGEEGEEGEHLGTATNTVPNQGKGWEKVGTMTCTCTPPNMSHR